MLIHYYYRAAFWQVSIAYRLFFVLSAVIQALIFFSRMVFLFILGAIYIDLKVL